MTKLEDFNRERRKAYSESRKPHPNGLQCPECSAELWDSDPMMTLTSNPPQKNIYCPQCGFTGRRVA